VANNINIPLISISDPSLLLSDDLPLSWYLGNESSENVPISISKILDTVAEYFGSHLILAGGSGGGFAALTQSSLLKSKCSVIVWNPQTNIINYEIDTLEKYLRTAFPSAKSELDDIQNFSISDKHEYYERFLHREKVFYKLDKKILNSSVPILYLQNCHDWHVSSHAIPFLGSQNWRRLSKSSFLTREDCILFLGDWGIGHAGPPIDLIERVIESYAQGYSFNKITLSILDKISKYYCQSFKSDILSDNWEPSIDLNYHPDGVSVEIGRSSLVNEGGFQYALYCLKNGARKRSFWYQESPIFIINEDDFDCDSIQVFVKDFFDEKRIFYKKLDFGSFLTPSQNIDLSAEFNCILDKNLNFIPQDFPVITKERFDNGEISLKISPFGEDLVLSKSFCVVWGRSFASNHRSNQMWLLSLDFVGRLLSSYEANRDFAFLEMSSKCIKEFIDYCHDEKNFHDVSNIGSRDHSTAIRVKVLFKFLYLTKGMEEFEPLRLVVFKQLCIWLDWLCNPAYFHATNHGLMTSISLIVCSMCFNLNSVLGYRYKSIGIARVIKIARIAFDKEGLCYENTIGYHNYNLGLYKLILRFLKSHNIDTVYNDELESIIDKADDALGYCIRQDSTIPPIGDSPVYKLNVDSINHSKCFFDSGFAVVKNDDLYLSLQCGSRTEFHKQMDDSSITLRYKNQDIIIDAGSYSYDRIDGFGRYVESSLGHSGIFPKIFDNLRRKEVLHKFGEITGSIEYFEENETGVSVKCFYKNERNDFIISRNIKVDWPSRISIEDTFEAVDEFEEIGFVQRFLLSPDLELINSSDSCCEFLSDEIKGKICFIDCSDAIEVFNGVTIPEIKGWHSVNFGEILTNPTIERTFKCRHKTFLTVIELS